MSDRLTERSSAPAVEVGEQKSLDAVTSTVADLGELHSAATARTRLLLELFPRDAGASVLPSAESALVLSELSWANEMQESLALEADQAEAEEPSMSPMWAQLMTYVDHLVATVLAEQETPTPDRDRNDILGSEQPIPG